MLGRFSRTVSRSTVVLLMVVGSVFSVSLATPTPAAALSRCYSLFARSPITSSPGVAYGASVKCSPATTGTMHIAMYRQDGYLYSEGWSTFIAYGTETWYTKTVNCPWTIVRYNYYTYATWSWTEAGQTYTLGPVYSPSSNICQ